MSENHISPAISHQSKHYPASWRGKVPKRVKMAKSVRPDIPVIAGLTGYTGADFCENDQEYEVYVNSHGAVSAILPSGKCLGLRPYEFEVIEWHSVE